MSNILFILLVAVTGAGLSLQAAMNSRLREQIGQPVVAALISFVVGSALLLALLGFGWMGKAKIEGLSAIPWWAWFGGIAGAAYVVTAVVAVPRIGTATLVCAAVCGQMIAALVLDSFGLLGVPKLTLSIWRIVGSILLVLGVLLMQKK